MRYSRYHATLAQSVEQCFRKAEVRGSNPRGGSIPFQVSGFGARDKVGRRLSTLSRASGSRDLERNATKTPHQQMGCFGHLSSNYSVNGKSNSSTNCRAKAGVVATMPFTI